ncbi:MAG TPA: hypothetical protein VHN14_01880 [Kofleriaceae bacterium]|nr:hypothetical protein [Kofleriaceae bacterium]
MTACPRCETALEDGDLRCAICALPVPAATRPSDGTQNAQVLRCTECGAAVAFLAEAQAPRCGFCGQAMAIEQPVDPIETARLVLPFSVDRGAAEAALRGWLSRRGWFAPRALSSEAVLESLTPLSWAAWLVNASALVTWTADSDAGANRSAWAPHAGQVSLGFHNIVVPASRGLRAAELRKLIPSYVLDGVVGVDRPLAAGAVGSTIEQFDAQRSAARRYVQDAIEAAAKLRVEPQIPGRRFRNVHVACLIERQTTDRIALPAWVLAYRYRGTAYRALVHGQRSDIVFGASPIDWGKVGTLVAIVAVMAALIALAMIFH